MRKITALLFICLSLFSCKKDAGTLTGPQQSQDGKYLSNYTVQTSCTSCDLTQPVTITGTGFTPRLQITIDVNRKNFDWINYEVIGRFTVATVDSQGNFSFNYDVSGYAPSEWQIFIYETGSNSRVTRARYGELRFRTY